MQCLLIEDNAVDAKWALQAMPEGTRTIHVSTMAEALATLTTHEFDLAILDLRLPDSLDIETVTRFNAAAPDLPKLGYTGLHDISLAYYLVKSGMTWVFFKPDASMDDINEIAQRLFRETVLLTHANAMATHALMNSLSTVPAMISRIEARLDALGAVAARVPELEEGCKKNEENLKILAETTQAFQTLLMTQAMDRAKLRWDLFGKIVAGIFGLATIITGAWAAVRWR